VLCQFDDDNKSVLHIHAIDVLHIMNCILTAIVFHAIKNNNNFLKLPKKILQMTTFWTKVHETALIAKVPHQFQ